MKYVTLPNGKRCALGAYAKAWRALKNMPASALVPGFADFPERAESILCAMRGGLSERINRHDAAHGVGRKWSNEYFIKAWRDSRRLQDIARRVRVYQFETHEATSRFGHLLSTYGE